MAKLKTLTIDNLVRILCALSLALSVFAHCASTSQANDLSAVDLAAFTLPDGSIPSICLNDDVNGEAHLTQKSCEFCRAATISILPEQASHFEIFKPRLGNKILPPDQVAKITTKFITQHPTRAPPQTI